jgi:hypothetical protein
MDILPLLFFISTIACDPCHTRTVISGIIWQLPNRDRVLLIKDSTFVGCQTYTDLGGAFLFSFTSSPSGTSFTAQNCHFVDCRTTKNGGAIYFEAGNCFLTNTDFVNCQASAEESCCCLISHAATSTINLDQVSYSRCSCQKNSIYARFDVNSGSARGDISFLNLNATLNRASVQCSALFLDNHHALVMTFATLRSNYYAGVLWLGYEESNHRLSCIDFRNHSHSTSGTAASATAAITVTRAYTFTACTFQENKIGRWLSGPDPPNMPWGYVSPTVTFQNCIVDFQSFSTTKCYASSPGRILLSQGISILPVCAVLPTSEFTMQARYRYRAVHYVLAIEAFALLIHSSN